MAVLIWIKSKKAFLKIQEGIGDNLLKEDKDNGFVDYVLWSTFRPLILTANLKWNVLILEC